MFGVVLNKVGFLASEAIEVLRKARAFVIKRVGQEPQPGPEASKGQLTWAKCESVAAAREQAKQRANWPY